MKFYAIENNLKYIEVSPDQKRITEKAEQMGANVETLELSPFKYKLARAMYSAADLSGLDQNEKDELLYDCFHFETVEICHAYTGYQIRNGKATDTEKELFKMLEQYFDNLEGNF